jgi:hypothetical protein
MPSPRRHPSISIASGQRPGVKRLEARIVEGNHRRVELVPGERQLREDHDPRARLQHDRGVRPSVRADVVGDGERLGRRDRERG